METVLWCSMYGDMEFLTLSLRLCNFFQIRSRAATTCFDPESACFKNHFTGMTILEVQLRGLFVTKHLLGPLCTLRPVWTWRTRWRARLPAFEVPRVWWAGLDGTGARERGQFGDRRQFGD